MFKCIPIFSILLILLTTLNSACGASLKEKTDTLFNLKAHVIEDIMSNPVNEKETLAIAEKMNSDGSWSDIDYANKTRGGWPVNNHNVRVLNMAIVYKKNKSLNKVLKKKILNGLDYWLQNDFICPNWWYPQIGVPKTIGPAMILMESDLTKSQLNKGLEILERAKIGMTGQNRVWLSGNVIYRSLLTDDITSIREAATAIENEITISDKEGIQYDYSFHQHGPQQQFGNYGYSFAADMEKWGKIFIGTPFQFDNQKIFILRNYLLDGMRWVLWHKTLDISACGRQLFEDAPKEKAEGIIDIFQKMPDVDSAFRKEYLAATKDFDGNKHFWNSDMSVHRRSNFYTSVKMCSERVSGAESCNSENALGYHLADGATYFYQSGKEYENIFPFWDWKLIPGTTTLHDDAALPVLPCSGYTLKTDFVGGVDDGHNGIATMAYKRDGVSAQKSWFFFNDAIICLGTDINSDKKGHITTSINQSLLNGEVKIWQNNGLVKLQMGTYQLQNTSWVIHDRWGYYFPNPTTVSLKNQKQSGDWNRVMKSIPSKKMEANLFTLWIDHGEKLQQASYAYYVFPNAIENSMQKRADYITIKNTGQLQIAEDKNQHLTGIVFTNKGTANSVLFNNITADKPCILLLKRKNGKIAITVSEPTQKQKNLTLTFSGKKQSGTVKGSYDAAKNQTSFLIPLPSNENVGKCFEYYIQ